MPRFGRSGVAKYTLDLFCTLIYQPPLAGSNKALQERDFHNVSSIVSGIYRTVRSTNFTIYWLGCHQRLRSYDNASVNEVLEQHIFILGFGVATESFRLYIDGTPI